MKNIMIVIFSLTLVACADSSSDGAKLLADDSDSGQPIENIGDDGDSSEPPTLLVGSTIYSGHYVANEDSSQTIDLGADGSFSINAIQDAHITQGMAHYTNQYACSATGSLGALVTTYPAANGNVGYDLSLTVTTSTYFVHPSGLPTIVDGCPYSGHNRVVIQVRDPSLSCFEFTTRSSPNDAFHPSSGVGRDSSNQQVTFCLED